jgi:hypothetical protein
MSYRPWFYMGVMLSMALSGSSLFAQAADPLMGTWTLNLAKSKYNPASAAPKSQLVTFEAAGQGVKVSAKGVDAKGQPTSTAYTANFDGKDYPVTGVPAYDAVALRRTSRWSYQGARKKAGKVVQTYSVTISRDGKTATNRTQGTGGDGQKIDHLIVFDKQQ